MTKSLAQPRPKRRGGAGPQTHLGEEAVTPADLIVHVLVAEERAITDPPGHAPRQCKGHDGRIPSERLPCQPELVSAIAGQVVAVVHVRWLRAVSGHDVATNLDLAYLQSRAVGREIKGVQDQRATRLRVVTQEARRRAC